ncbi:MAG: sulfite exporter TauE/SafE family protein [Erysipelotrichaceae bacterium]
MIGVIYAIVIFVATFLGASAGLGGGVIIKPVLDFINVHDLSTISFLSSSAVFTMAVYSTIKQYLNKVKFDYVMIVLVAIGAIIGGNIGSSLFSYLLGIMDNGMLKFMQAVMLAVLLVIVIVNVNTKHKNFCVKSKAVTLIIGLLLGAISSFLGIGGGPINVAVFVFFFSVDMKTATVYSIATILFSQVSKLINIGINTGFGSFDLSLLLFVLPSAILGGIFGTRLNRKASEKMIKTIFNVTVICIILLNIYNAINALG